MRNNNNNNNNKKKSGLAAVNYESHLMSTSRNLSISPLPPSPIPSPSSGVISSRKTTLTSGTHEYANG